MALYLAFVFYSCEGKMRCLHRTLRHQFMNFSESIKVFSVVRNGFLSQAKYDSRKLWEAVAKLP